MSFDASLYSRQLLSYGQRSYKYSRHTLVRYWQRGIWNKLKLLLLAAVLTIIIIMYSIASWYIHSQASKPLQLGISFIPDYAQSLGVNPQQTMQALLGIGVRQLRLVSYWNDLEPSPGHYNFQQLDWQFKMAEQKHAHIILTVGLRQPRWPECHMPSWAAQEPSRVWQPQLERLMRAVVERYKSSPSLEAYQLENEYFLKGFGDCTNFSRSRLISEYNLIAKTDPSHPIIVGRSNNALGIPLGAPKPAIYSISIYRRTWDTTYTHRYMEYPYPAWFYGFLAGLQELVDHRNMIIGELQAEPWPPHNESIPQSSLQEQNKSLSAARLQDTIRFAEQTGMRRINLWGAEYWYYRLTIEHDPSVWRVAQQAFKNSSSSRYSLPSGT